MLEKTRLRIGLNDKLKVGYSDPGLDLFMQKKEGLDFSNPSYKPQLYSSSIIVSPDFV